MAASRQDLFHNLEDILACAFCLERCQKPTSLACLHSFCLQCLEQLHQMSGQTGSVVCPSCNTSSDPQAGIHEYPGAFLLNTLAEAVDKLKVLKLGDRPLCADCTRNGEQKNAHKLCIDCVKPFCGECLEKHDQVKSNHNVLECDNIKADNISHMLKSMAHQCPKHEDKHIDVYCEECQEIVCSDCAGSDHATHTKQDLHKVAETHREGLGNMKVELSTKVLHYERCLQVIDKTTEDTESDEQSKLEMVDKHGQELMNHVQMLTEQVKNEIRSETAKSVGNLHVLHDTVLHELSRLKNTETHIEASLTHGNNTTVTNTSVKEKPKYETMLQDLVPKHDIPKQTITLQLIDVKKLLGDTLIGDIQFSTQKEALQEGIPELSPSQCGNLVVKKVRQFKTPYYPCGITCLPDGQIVTCSNYGSQVSLFGQDGSKKMDLQTPEDTAATDVTSADGSILVADCTTESILVFNNDGSFERSIPVGFRGGAGICVNDKKLYVTTFNDSTTITLDWPSGDKRHTFVQEASQAGMQRPHFVAAGRNKVTMSCYDNKTVHMYNKAAQFQYSYKGQGSSQGSLGSAYGVVIDAMGRLLISDTDNHCVHIVSTQGQCVGQIYLDKDGLKKPLGLAINSRGQLVVSANGSKAVAVYQYRFK